MKTTTVRVLVVCMSLLAMSAVDGETQEREARAVILRSLELMGGAGRFEGAALVQTTARVTRRQIGQAQTPEAEGTWSPPQPTLYRITQEVATSRTEAVVLSPAGEPVTRMVRGAERVFIHQVARNIVQLLPNDLPLRGLWEVAAFPPTLLLNALNQDGELRLSPRPIGDGIEALVVRYRDAGGVPVELRFGIADTLLHAYLRAEEHPQLGDAPRMVTYEEYRVEEGMRLPQRVELSVGPYQEAMATVESFGFPTGDTDRRFEFPDEASVAGSPLPMGDAATMRVSEVAPGVFLVLNVIAGYNALFVEQSDGVVVVDAPGGVEGSARVMDAVREHTAEPITHHVVTHHHFDHTDGTWAYARDGARIVAPEGIVDFVRGICTAPRSARGAPAGWEPRLETVAERATLGTGPNRIEVIEVGPNPHSAEILIAYLPQHRLLYVADIYGYLPGFTPPPFLQAFDERLKGLGLEVETFLTAHTEPRSAAEYAAMVRSVGR